MGLVVAVPIGCLVALAILFDDGRPILFCQARRGKDGHLFKVLKFRSMRKDSFHPRSTQAQGRDPRITRLGWFLRESSLDELPQLWNILKGDMSFVGPRPLPIDEIQAQEVERDVPDEAIAGFRERHTVTPGLTGIAQLFAARDVPRRFKFRYDLFYIKHRTLWLDIRLILLSCYVVTVGHRGVRGRKLIKNRTA